MLGLPSSYHQATNDRRSLYAEASGNATREKGLTHTPELPSTTGRDPDGAWASLFPRLHCCELEIRRFPSRRQSRLGSCRRPLGTAGAHSPGSASTKKVRHPRVESRQEPRIARALIENTAGTTHVTASAARSFARLNFGHWTKFCSPLFSLSHVGTPPLSNLLFRTPRPTKGRRRNLTSSQLSATNRLLETSGFYPILRATENSRSPSRRLPPPCPQPPRINLRFNARKGLKNLGTFGRLAESIQDGGICTSPDLRHDL